MLTSEQQQKIITLIKHKVEEKEWDIEYTENANWSNFCKTVNLEDILLLKIYDLLSARELIAYIDSLNAEEEPGNQIICRTAAGGKNHERYSHSFSLTPLVDSDIVMNMIFENNLNSIVKLDDKTVRVLPGLQIGDGDDMLDYRFRLATKVPGSLINRVTIIGLAATGGHGGDMRFGAYPSNIKAITFLLQKGTSKTLRRDSEDPEERKLFQIFASTHLGLPGIVVEMEMECKPAEKLECVETPMSLSDFFKKVRNGELPRASHPIFSVYYAPTGEDDLTNDLLTVKVTESRPVPLDTPDYNLDVEERQKKQDFQISMEEGLRVTDVISCFPQLLTPYMKYVISPLAIGKQQNTYIASMPDVYHSQVSYPSNINDVDCLFPVDDQFEQMLEAFEKVNFETTVAHERGEAPVMYGAYARLILNEKLECSLAPGSHHCDNKYICCFDVVSSPGAPGFEAFRDDLIKHFIEKYRAKLHWGKDVPLDKGIDYEKMYEHDLPEFRRVLRKWYKDNGVDITRSPFINAFTREVLNLDKIDLVEEEVLGEKELPVVCETSADEGKEKECPVKLRPTVSYKDIRNLNKFKDWVKKHEHMKDSHKEKLTCCLDKAHKDALAAQPSGVTDFFTSIPVTEQLEQSLAWCNLY